MPAQISPSPACRPLTTPTPRTKQACQQVRSAYTAASPAAGKIIAENIVDTFPNCPITEIGRLGRTLRQWKDTYLGYITTGGANNGGTEAINGIIELHRRIARGYRNPDNYRLRMLPAAGGLLLPLDLR
jgi:transposase